VLGTFVRLIVACTCSALLLALIVAASSLGRSVGSVSTSVPVTSAQTIRPSDKVSDPSELANRAKRIKELVQGKSVDPLPGGAGPQLPSANAKIGFKQAPEDSPPGFDFAAQVTVYWLAFLRASHLDRAPPGMIGMYGLLMFSFSVGLFCILDYNKNVRLQDPGNPASAKRLRNIVTVEFCAHSLPFLGVTGTLLSFMMFAADPNAASGDLKAAFVSSLSFAAFTTIYGLLGSLILEAWLFTHDGRDG
jgi:hypothetical protein